MTKRAARNIPSRLKRFLLPRKDFLILKKDNDEKLAIPKITKSRFRSLGFFATAPSKSTKRKAPTTPPISNPKEDDK